MSGNRSDHDFDWMRDYLVCSVACEFDLLKTDAKGATDTYRTQRLISKSTLNLRSSSNANRVKKNTITLWSARRTSNTNTPALA